MGGDGFLGREMGFGKWRSVVGGWWVLGENGVLGEGIWVFFGGEWVGGEMDIGVETDFFGGDRLILGGILEEVDFFTGITRLFGGLSGFDGEGETQESWQGPSV